MAQIIITLGGATRLTDSSRGPLNDLAGELTSDDVGAKVASQDFGGTGVTFGEVVILYLWTQGTDVLVGRVFDAMIDRVIQIAKGWAGRRVQERIEDEKIVRVRSTFVTLVDQDGNIYGKVVAEGQDGQLKVTVDAERKQAPQLGGPAPIDQEDFEALWNDDI